MTIDEILLDIEHRAEQVRQMKSYEGRRLFIQAMTMVAALLGAEEPRPDAWRRRRSLDASRVAERLARPTPSATTISYCR